MIRSLLPALLLLSSICSAVAQQPIRTGIDATFAPHAMPKAGGGLEGFNIDLANDLARRMGRPITIDGTEIGRASL
jgi:polar amino acid transport system substrate-binding protein